MCKDDDFSQLDKDTLIRLYQKDILQKTQDEVVKNFKNQFWFLIGTVVVLSSFAFTIVYNFVLSSADRKINTVISERFVKELDRSKKSTDEATKRFNDTMYQSLKETAEATARTNFAAEIATETANATKSQLNSLTEQFGGFDASLNKLIHRSDSTAKAIKLQMEDLGQNLSELTAKTDLAADAVFTLFDEIQKNFQLSEEAKKSLDKYIANSKYTVTISIMSSIVPSSAKELYKKLKSYKFIVPEIKSWDYLGPVETSKAIIYYNAFGQEKAQEVYEILDQIGGFELKLSGRVTPECWGDLAISIQ